MTTDSSIKQHKRNTANEPQCDKQDGVEIANKKQKTADGASSNVKNRAQSSSSTVPSKFELELAALQQQMHHLEQGSKSLLIDSP